MTEERGMKLHKRNPELAFIWYELMSNQARHLARRSLILVLVGSLLLIAAPYGISIFIDGLTNQIMDAMLVGGVVYAGLKLFDIIIGLWRQRLREYFFQEEFWYLPQAITRLSFARPLSFLTSHSSDIDGGGIESLRDKVWSVIGSYIYTIIPIYGQTLFGLGACYLAHPIVGGVAILYVVVELTLGRMNNRFIQREMRPIIDQFKRWDRRMTEWWHNLDHIKYQGVETKILNLIHAEVQDALAGDDRVWRIYYARWIAIRRIISLGFSVSVFGTVGYLVYEGMVTGASGVLVFFALERVQSMLYELSDQQREVQFNLASIAKYRRALVRPVPFTYHGGIEFTEPTIDVTFDRVTHFVESEGIGVPILRAVSLIIPAGMKVGIVGPSGAGKSQLLSLLVQASNPDHGRILISGHDLRELSTESFLRYVGVIMQKSEPYEDTILGNLLFGISHLDLPVPFEQLPEVERKQILMLAHLALTKAGLDAPMFPQGIMTNIGYKGTKLSGGQQQRLQIAGAHLKLAMSDTRPRLVIADEPTSALDSLSEQTVMAHLQDGLPDGTTLLMVAHRLSTVARMDRIIFVRPLSLCHSEEPQVTMHNSLRELYTLEPLFREMADAQGFRP